MPKKIKVSRFNEVSAPDASGAKKYIVAVLCIVLLLGGFAFGRKTAPKSTPPINTQKESSVAQVKTGAGPHDTSDVVPKDFDHSTKGAVAAASTYISISTRMFLLKEKPFEEAIGDMSTAEYKSTLFAGFLSTKTGALKVFQTDPNAFYREFPMGYVVVSEEKDEVVISVWTQLMLVAKPEYNGITETKVHTMTLVWEKGDWKIDNWVNSPGPTPNWQAANQPLTIDEYAAAIRPFTGGFDYAPSF